MKHLVQTILEFKADRSIVKKGTVYPDDIKPGDMFRLKLSPDREIFSSLTSIKKKYLGDIVTIQELHKPGFLTEPGYTVYVEENPELWPIEILEYI